MALRTGAPVIPVAVAGTQNVKQLDTKWWKWGWRQHYVIVIGEPIQPPTKDDPTYRDAFTAHFAQIQPLRAAWETYAAVRRTAAQRHGSRLCRARTAT